MYISLHLQNYRKNNYKKILSVENNRNSCRVIKENNGTYFLSTDTLACNVVEYPFVNWQRRYWCTSPSRKFWKFWHTVPTKWGIGTLFYTETSPYERTETFWQCIHANCLNCWVFGENFQRHSWEIGPVGVVNTIWVHNRGFSKWNSDSLPARQKSPNVGLILISKFMNS